MTIRPRGFDGWNESIANVERQEVELGFDPVLIYYVKMAHSDMTRHGYLAYHNHQSRVAFFHEMYKSQSHIYLPIMSIRMRSIRPVIGQRIALFSTSSSAQKDVPAPKQGQQEPPKPSTAFDLGFGTKNATRVRNFDKIDLPEVSTSKIDLGSGSGAKPSASLGFYFIPKIY